jgi:antibiotic biosynthesis monooxygenase (ABM) superfamily enzyme
MSRYHVAITRRIRRGKEVEFEAALGEFAKRSLHTSGTTGVHLIGPVPGSPSNDYGILRSFESEEASHKFYSSPLYLEWKECVKMAVVTWFGVFPTVWLWSSTLPKIMTGVPSLFTMAIVDVLVVVTLAWFAMPLLTRLFACWLRPVVGGGKSHGT